MHIRSDQASDSFRSNSFSCSCSHSRVRAGLHLSILVLFTFLNTRLGSYILHLLPRSCPFSLLLTLQSVVTSSALRIRVSILVRSISSFLAHFTRVAARVTVAPVHLWYLYPRLVQLLRQRNGELLRNRAGAMCSARQRWLS
jgi:hypothetical protein